MHHSGASHEHEAAGAVSWHGVAPASGPPKLDMPHLLLLSCSCLGARPRVGEREREMEEIEKRELPLGMVTTFAFRTMTCVFEYTLVSTRRDEFFSHSLFDIVRWMDGRTATGETSGLCLTGVSSLSQRCATIPQMRLSNVSRTLTDLCVVSAWSQQQSHFVSRMSHTRHSHLQRRV